MWLRIRAQIRNENLKISPVVEKKRVMYSRISSSNRNMGLLEISMEAITSDANGQSGRFRLQTNVLSSNVKDEVVLLDSESLFVVPFLYTYIRMIIMISRKS